jgi:NADH-quinone oxidoreductase subunit A
MINSTLFQVLLFCGIGLIFGGILATLSLVVQKIFLIGTPRQIKNQVYECGMKPLGKSQIQFDIKYYVFALLFIVFDVEFVFLMPWALSMSSSVASKLFLIVEAFIFIAILGFGLYYAWRKKALEWE